jgi:hypothetical protein
MGREVRRVPADWQHPVDDVGDYIPLLDGFNSRLREWDEEAARWAEGLQSDWNGGWKPIDEKDRGMTYAEWSGERPKPEDYMPDWPETNRTHYQMYEDTSEGTPISPVMGTPEELARWLADNGASAFADQTATYEQWLGMIGRGSSVSAVVTNGVMQSGVAFIGDLATKDS